MRTTSQQFSVFLSGLVLGVWAALPAAAQTFSNWSPPVSLTTVNSNAFDG
jgi:hypothetical protein